MRLQKKLPIWLTGVALGASTIAFPTLPAFAAPAADAAKPQKVDKDEVPDAVKKAFKEHLKNAADVNYFKVTQNGQSYFMARGLAGEKGGRKQMVFAADGTAVSELGPVGDPVIAAAAAPATATPATPAADVAALQAQAAQYRTQVESERTEMEREAQRAKDVASRVAAGTLKDAALATEESAGAERERQAFTRYREASQQATDYRTRSTSTTLNAPVREQYAALAQLADERARINTEAARYASETQRNLDQVELAGDAQPAQTGVTRKKLTVNDLPPKVREAFGTQTDGATGQSYFLTSSGGRNYYTVQYARGGSQYFMRANDQGQVVRGPVAMTDDAKQAAARVPGSGSADDNAPAGSQIGTLGDIPGAAKATFQKEMNDRAQKNATFFKEIKNGKAVYHAIWHPEGDRSKDYHLFVDEDGKVVRKAVLDNPNAKK